MVSSLPKKRKLYAQTRPSSYPYGPIARMRICRVGAPSPTWRLVTNIEGEWLDYESPDATPSDKSRRELG
jgi:hypothetical protein